jgi:hypothetical protein
MKHWFSILCLGLINTAVFSQTTKQVTHQQLIWYGYYNTLQFNQKYFLTTEIQERHFINPFAQHQFVLRSHIHRNVGAGWDVALGMCLFLQSPQDPTSESDLIVPELRPHIALANQTKLNRFTINQRYKAEARFFHEVENNELVNGYHFGNFRFRYQIGIEIPVYKKWLSVKLSDEVMLNAGKNITYNIFDQNRIYVALNYNITPNLRLETGYLNWYQQRASGNSFYNRDIIRFTVFHKIHFQK